MVRYVLERVSTMGDARAQSEAGGTTFNRVLVIDDEPALLAMLSHALRRDGYAVTSCRDGAEALGAMTRGAYDVILTDVSLPKMSGIDLIKEVRRHDLDVPVLLMTGHTLEDAVGAASEHGALRCLEKPFDLGTLRANVARAVALHKFVIAKRRAQQ